MAFPAKPIRLIVPFAAGGTSDVIARLIAQPMAKELGQPVVVENRAGAGGMLGTEALALAEPDGYTLGLATASTMAVNPIFYAKAARTSQQLRPLARLVNVPSVLAVHPAMGVKDFAGFVAELKRKPGFYSCPTPGVGSLGHLMLAAMNERLGVKMVGVPYRGMGAALNDALAGTVQIMPDQLPSVRSHIKAGKLLPLAVFADKRVAELPQVPTFKELGYGELSDLGSTWFGLAVPAKTPSAVADKLRVAALKAVQAPEVVARLQDMGASVAASDGQAFQQHIDAQLKRNRGIAERGGITVE
ncbi:Bug family tripartite tricarboxylate transporter substrate binding protein [Cupriavidus necator]|nr:tripartite tricarboxylate transporter substrate-binding protein [Cupriavidus necator]